MIDLYQLCGIWNCPIKTVAAHEVEELNQCLQRFDITTLSRMHHFMAQTGHESGGGRWKKELSDGWYLEWRDDLGNVHQGDGPKYKGAGYLQTTGRHNYERLAKFLNDPKVMDGCDYVAEKYPFTAAGFWWMDNDMNALCDQLPSVETVTRRVNGGLNGLEDRKMYFARAQQLILDQ